MTNPLNKIISWYFTKNTLPYWCVLILDSIIVFLSGIFTFWTFRKTAVLFDLRFEVLYTMLIYMLFAIIGLCGGSGLRQPFFINTSADLFAGNGR